MKINKFLYGVLAICGCVVSVYLFRELLAFFSPDDLGTTLMAVSGAAATAGETMRGTVTTTKPAKADGTVDDQDINRPTISKKITKINPSLFPMDTLLRELENVPCSSFEYQYYSVRGRGVQSKVKTAYTVTAGSESGAKQINVINAHIFSQDGNVLFPTMNVDNATKVATPVASGGFSLNPLICHIVATDSIAQDKSRSTRSTQRYCPRCPSILRSIGSALQSTRTPVCRKTPARCPTRIATTVRFT